MENNSTVSFTIRDVTNIVTPDGVSINPLVIVRCCAKEYRTEIKYDKLGVVNFDVNHTWSDLKFSASTFEEAIIEFELESANALWANTVIGNAALQLRAINNRQNHTFNGPLQLQAVNKAAPSAIINVTVSVLQPGDVLRVEEEDGKDMAGLDDTFDKVIIKAGKPEQKGTPHHLTVSIYRVEYGPVSTTRGAGPFGDPSTTPVPRDLFLTCEFAGCKLKTSIHKRTNATTFNESFRIPVVSPLIEDSIVLGLWDSNPTGSELLARGSLSYLAISSQALATRWFNLYGFPPGEAAIFGDTDWDCISERKCEGTSFLGRIHLHASVHRLREMSALLPAELTVTKSRFDAHFSAMSYFVDVYEVTVDPAKCYDLCLRSGLHGIEDIRVVVSCGNSFVTSPAVPARKNLVDDGSGVLGYPFVKDHGSLAPLIVQLTGDEKAYPDIFVEVYCKKTRVAYRRIPSPRIPLMNEAYQSSPPLWVPLRNPFSFYVDSLPVNILMSIEKGKGESVRRRRRRRIIGAPYVVRCYLYAARYLNFIRTPNDPKRADPDPIVEVTCAGISDRTPAASNTRFPVWLHTLQLSCRLMIDANDGVPVLCPIIVEVKNDEQTLGSCIAGYTRLVGHREATEGTVDNLTPSWITLHRPEDFQLKLGTQDVRASTTNAGHILLSIEVLRRQDAQFIAVQNIMPPMKTIICRISLWGLREVLGALREDCETSAVTGATYQKVLKRNDVGAPTLAIVLPQYVDRAEENTLWVPWRNTMLDSGAQGGGGGSNEHTTHTYLHNANWRETEALGAFDHHFVTGVEIEIPANPLFDPHVCIRAYDDRSNFLGEAAMPLFNLLPWVAGTEHSSGGNPGATDDAEDMMDDQSDSGGAVRVIDSNAIYRDNRIPALDVAPRLIAKQSLQETPDFANTRSAYQSALKEMRGCSLEAFQTDAQRWLAKDVAKQLAAPGERSLSSLSTMASEGELAHKALDEADDDGVPISTKRADLVLKSQYAYDVRPFYHRLRAPGVRLPRHMSIFVEGVAGTPLAKDLRRPVIDQCLEQTLTDVHWRGITLWRPYPAVPGRLLKGGALKVEIAVTGESTVKPNPKTTTITKADLPDDLVRMGFSNKRFRTACRPGFKVLPETLRVRVYVLRIAAISLANTVTRSAIYPGSHLARHPVQLELRLSDKRCENLTSKTEGPHPQFMAFQELDISVPQEAVMTISAWSLPPDNEEPVYIGQTRVDLLERFLSPEYNEMLTSLQVPIEIRPLKYTDNATAVNGSLEVLIEVFRPSLSLARMPMIEDSVAAVELRLVVWGCRALATPPAMPSIDVLVKCGLDSPTYGGTQPLEQCTDVHYGSTNGNTIYNWRVVYSEIGVPCTSAVLTITASLFHSLSAEKPLGEVNLELGSYLKAVAASQEKLVYDVELKLYDQDSNAVGFVQLSVQILPQGQANARPAGLAQNAPNIDPPLQAPVTGRKWSDFLGTAGASVSFDVVWLRVRWTTTVVCLFVALFLGFIKPGLFWAGAAG